MGGEGECNFRGQKGGVRGAEWQCFGLKAKGRLLEVERKTYQASRWRHIRIFLTSSFLLPSKRT